MLALNWQVAIVPVLAVGALVFGVEFVYRWAWLGIVLGLFMSGAVLQALQDNPDRLDFHKDRTKVTVLFADIRGFTAYSDQKPPDTVIDMLNSYFGAVVPVVEAQGVS
jgi:class 3 adenylate cyclase